MEDKMLKLPEVLALIPVSRSKWYEGVKSGIFPEKQKIGRSSFWRMSDVQKLISKTPENQPMPASSPCAR